MIKSILFLPHGMQIIPNVEEKQNDGFKKINNEIKLLISHFEKENESSDVILVTPHGYNLEEKMVLYNHERFFGFIYKLNSESNILGDELIKIEINGNVELNQDISKSYNDITNLEVLTHGFPAYPMMLNWGEIVPLHYFNNNNKEFKYTIMCYPRSRHSELVDIIEINRTFVDMLMNLKEDIILVISGDLSHVHKKDGPYGFDESCIRFDNLVNDWARNGKDKTMNEILQLQPKALACGMSGLDLIHQIRKIGKYSLRYHFYEVPTYFGMGGYWWERS